MTAMSMDTGAGGKQQPPPMQTASTNAAQAHLQQGAVAGGNLIRAGGNDTSRKQRGKQLLFSPLLVGTGDFYFTRPRYFTKECKNL